MQRLKMNIYVFVITSVFDSIMWKTPSSCGFVKHTLIYYHCGIMNSWESEGEEQTDSPLFFSWWISMQRIESQIRIFEICISITINVSGTTLMSKFHGMEVMYRVY